MKTLRKLLLLAGGLTGLSSATIAQTAAQAAGHWEGTIKMENMDLGVVVDLAQNPTGAWIGALSITGSSTRDVPLGDLAVTERSVRFTARLPGRAAFEGSLSADATTLQGTASNAQGDTTFALTRTGAANVKVPAPSSPLTKEFAGRWEGMMTAGDKVRRIGLQLAPGPRETAVATLVAVDHGNLEIPVTTVTIEGRLLRLEVRAISGAYRGTLGDNGEITGDWSEAGKTLALNFKAAPAAPKAP